MWAGLALVCTRTASAQEPSTPPPPAGGRGHEGTRYHELLPDIGRIGAQVGAAIGPSWNPYEVGEGWQVAAFIDLPLARNRAGEDAAESGSNEPEINSMPRTGADSSSLPNF